MRDVYDDETVAYLGYQKRVPELRDWVFATLGVIAVFAILAGIIIAIKVYA